MKAKSCLFASVVALAALSLLGVTNDWENPAVNSINREEARRLGLGGASCGKPPLEKYRFKSQSEEWTVVVSVLRPKTAL